MAISPRIVTADVVLAWDGVQQRLPKGQVIDVPPDSPLERAIGRDKLVPLGATSALPPAEPPAEEAPAEKPQQEESLAAPPKPVAQAKQQDTETAPARSDSKGGDP